MITAGIIGCGKYLPESIIDNNYFVDQGLDTSDEWIQSRTGIKERRYLDPDLATSDMGYYAAIDAIKNATLTAQDIDLIIVATTSQDYPGFPSVACLLQDRLGLRNVGAFDLAAACSGFNMGLTTATQYVQTGLYKNILVVASDCLSRFVDKTDRSICILFGDGAAAVVVGEVEEGYGVLSSSLGADGSQGNILKIHSGGSKHPISEEYLKSKDHCIHMEGRSVFKVAVNSVLNQIEDDLTKNNMCKDDIDWFVFHQANLRIIQSASEKFGIEQEKIITTLHKYGNTSAASVPIILAEAEEEEKFKKGDLIYTIGFGAGFTWASNIIKWSR